MLSGLNYKRIAVLGVLGVACALLMSECVSQYKEYRVLKAEMLETQEHLNLVQKENQQNEEDIRYFSVPENLEKNLREKFNYKRPEEKMIIVVPRDQQSAERARE